MTRPLSSVDDLKLRVLKDMAGREHPRHALGSVAVRFNLTASRVRELVSPHGWPSKPSMQRAIAVLEQAVAADEEPTTPVTAALSAGPTVREIDLDRLVDNPRNPVDRTEDLADMADSIKAAGVLSPLLVVPHQHQPGYYMVVAGHRRKHAARLAGRTTAPCIVRATEADAGEYLVLMVIENVHRKDLSAMQKAEAFGELRDKRGITQAEICRRTGLSVGTVAYYLTLLDLDDDTKEKVRTGEVHVTQAVDAVREHRRQNRARKDQGQPGRPVIVAANWFAKTHPLAGIVATACQHSTRPHIGRVGCGQCWEAAIRQDATEAVG